MSFFRNIVFTAILVGILGGFAVSAMQAFGTTPLILQAETFESAGEAPIAMMHRRPVLPFPPMSTMTRPGLRPMVSSARPIPSPPMC